MKKILLVLLILTACKPQHPLSGLYFSKNDRDVMEDLMAWEKTIPKNEEIFIFPMPALFYFATQRKNPVHSIVFGSGGGDYNEIEDEIMTINDLEKAHVKYILIANMCCDHSYERYIPVDRQSTESWNDAIKSRRPLDSERQSYPLLTKYINDHFVQTFGIPGFWTMIRFGDGDWKKTLKYGRRLHAHRMDDNQNK